MKHGGALAGIALGLALLGVGAWMASPKAKPEPAFFLNVPRVMGPQGHSGFLVGTDHCQDTSEAWQAWMGQAPLDRSDCIRLTPGMTQVTARFLTRSQSPQSVVLTSKVTDAGYELFWPNGSRVVPVLPAQESGRPIQKRAFRPR